MSNKQNPIVEISSKQLNFTKQGSNTEKNTKVTVTEAKQQQLNKK